MLRLLLLIRLSLVSALAPTRGLVLVLLIILLGACSGAVSQTPSVTATPQPTRGPTRVPLVFPTPAAGWSIYSRSTFQLALPDTWREYKLNETDLRATIEEAQSSNPPFADTLRGLLESEQYRSLIFYGAERAPSVVTRNVSIARITLPKGSTIRQVATAYAAALPATITGARVLSTEPELNVNGLAAAEIMYDVPLVNPGGQAVTLRGVQYLFLLDTGDLYLVTVTGDSADADSFMPLARSIARSFVGVAP